MPHAAPHISQAALDAKDTAARAAEAARLPLKEIRGWTYLKQAVGNDVFLVGLDDTVGIKGAEHLEYFGTLKAVTAFLEDEARFEQYLEARAWEREHLDALLTY